MFLVVTGMGLFSSCRTLRTRAALKGLVPVCGCALLCTGGLDEGFCEQHGATQALNFQQTLPVIDPRVSSPRSSSSRYAWKSGNTSLENESPRQEESRELVGQAWVLPGSGLGGLQSLFPGVPACVQFGKSGVGVAKTGNPSFPQRPAQAPVLGLASHHVLIRRLPPVICWLQAEAGHTDTVARGRAGRGHQPRSCACPGPPVCAVAVPSHPPVAAGIAHPVT